MFSFKFSCSLGLSFLSPVVSFLFRFVALVVEDSKKVYKFGGKYGEDFQLWLARTEAALQAKGVLHAVINDLLKEGGSEKITLSDIAVKKVSAARAIIMQGLRDPLLRLCLSVKHNPYKMWTRLKDCHLVSNTATQVQMQYRDSRMSYRIEPMQD